MGKKLKGFEALVRALGTVSVLGLIAAPGAVCAQGVPQGGAEASATAATGTDASATDDNAIVVTARKREERQIDVPISISTVTGKDLTDRGIGNVVDALHEIPSVGAEDAGGGIGSVQIRGISSSLGGNENGFYIDETPFTAVTTSFAPDTRSWDIQRIEVLRGPQGTLFGEGSMGGTVRIITASPDLRDAGVAASLSGSSVHDGESGWGIKGMVNVPIAEDKLAFRVSGTKERTPGWIDNATTGEEDVNEQNIETVRAKVRFRPVSRLTVDLSYWQSTNSSDAAGTSSGPDRTTNSVNAMDNRWHTTSLTGNYELDGSQITAVLSHANFDILTSQASPGITIDALVSIGVDTREVRWSSTGSRMFDWTIGYYNREATRDDRVDANLFGRAINSLTSQTNKADAIFGEGTFNFAEQWALTAGLRYFSDDVEASSVSAATGQVNSLDDTFSSWNPRVSLSFKPNIDTTIYASAAKGFRSGQLQPISSILIANAVGIALDPSVRPDTIWTYELGAKSLFADGKLLAEAAVYYSDWNDVAVRVPLVPGVNGLANSPGSTAKGAELSLTYKPLRGLDVRSAIGWVDATYSGDVAGTAITKGMQVYNVPKLTLTGSATYRWDLTDSLNAMVYGGFDYYSPRRTNALANNTTTGDSIFDASLRAGIEHENGLGLFVFVSNITDENGALSPPDATGVSSRRQPRTVGAELRFAL